MVASQRRVDYDAEENLKIFVLTTALSKAKLAFSQLISEHSAVRHQQYPTPRNTWFAIAFIAIVAPASLVAIPWVLAARILKRRKLEVTVLAVDNEFAPVIELLEFLRSTPPKERPWRYILILSRYQHTTLDALYSFSLQSRIIRSIGASRMLQQILLLQPGFLVERTQLRGSRSFSLPQTPLEADECLVRMRNECLAGIGLSDQRYVAMAVYTLQYDEERDPKEAQKHAMLESHGNNLAVGVDYLHQTDVGVVMLGSRDTKKAWVPRDIPRLSNFGHLGGADEVVLASGCEYFWNDSDVGAWWLGLPFKRPILTTNKPRIRMKTNLSDYEHLVVPVRYARPDGSDLTFRELLKMKSAPFKSAARGEIVMIRNSPDEIIEAHKEIRARISGTWSEDAQIPKLRDRCQQIFLEFPDTFPMRISAHFLTKHAHLLD